MLWGLYIPYLNMSNYTDKRTGIVYTNIVSSSASSRSASSRSAYSRSAYSRSASSRSAYSSSSSNADHLDVFIPPAFLKTYFGKD